MVYTSKEKSLFIFVGFLNVPVQAPTRDQPFLYGDSDTPPQLVAFNDTLGIRRTHSRIPPPRPHGGTCVIILISSNTDSLQYVTETRKSWSDSVWSTNLPLNIPRDAPQKKRPKMSTAKQIRTYNNKAYTSPSFFVNFSTFAFLSNFHLWSKETIKVLGIGAVFT